MSLQHDLIQLPLDSKGRLKWDSSGSGGRKTFLPCSSGSGVLKDEEPVETTPLVARYLRPGSRPRNAKKVLFAVAPEKAKEKLHPAEVSVAGKLENNQEVAEDSLSMLPGFSQVWRIGASSPSTKNIVNLFKGSSASVVRPPRVKGRGYQSSSSLCHPSCFHGKKRKGWIFSSKAFTSSSCNSTNT